MSYTTEHRIKENNNQAYNEDISKMRAKSLLIQSTMPRQNRVINTKRALIESVLCE